MIKDYAMKLDGAIIPNILEVTVKIQTPYDARGIYREPTFAADVIVVRDASNHAVVEPFLKATNIDGRKGIIAATIECHGDDIKDNYTFELKKAIVYDWSLHNPSEAAKPTLETFKLKVGEMEYKAGGKGASFALKSFR